MTTRKTEAFVLAVLAASLAFSSIAVAQNDDNESDSRTCIVHSDWRTFSSSKGQELQHAYRVQFYPSFPLAVDPSNVDVTATHLNDSGIQVGTSSSLTAGGVIDIQMTHPPSFGDIISISVDTTEASCERSFKVTMWNQPVMDHEITRETSWSLISGDDGTALSVNGRGWQQRSDLNLEANELGNGTVRLMLYDQDREIDVNLDVHRAWLNESWDGTDLSSQEFQLEGSGTIRMSLYDGLEGIAANGTVREARFTRTLENGIVTEHLELEANGSLILNSNEEGSLDVSGDISLLRYETTDVGGERVFQDIWIEAMATALIEFDSDRIEFELDEFIFRERWEGDQRIEQHQRFRGEGDFDVLIEDENGIQIEVNGTIDEIHNEQLDGLVIADTFILDGVYSGTASGTFGSVRQIVDFGIQTNSSGIDHDVVVIRDEYWFNVSGSAFTVPGQELYSDHNLTYAYMTPNVDWESPIVRYRYVEDNGEVNNEFPPESPRILTPVPPESVSILSSNVTRESGLVPDVLIRGDRVDLVKDGRFTMAVEVENTSIAYIDGHEVKSATWIGTYPGGGQATGSTVNEGILAGLLIYCERTMPIPVFEDQNPPVFRETQTVDRVLRPSVITAAENTLPEITSVAYREGIWRGEGDNVHLEITVEDPDTDVVSVMIDFHGEGWGILEFSDSGLSGDLVVHDDIWTAQTNSTGLFFGTMEATIYVQDIWATVSENVMLNITNPGPRVVEADRAPNRLSRGEEFSVSIIAYDMHGISTVSIDLQPYGGDKVMLELNENTWSGSALMPDGVSPGRVAFPVFLEDSFGARTIYTGGLGNDISFNVLNEPPVISPSVYIRTDSINELEEYLDSVVLPISGDPITQVLEVSVSDPDGVSVVQSKIGRLAPIGSSSAWLNMNDDGINGDKFAGDGIYSLEFNARSSLEPGLMEIRIRATDIYQSMTPLEEQNRQISLVKEESPNSSSWLGSNTDILAVLAAALLTMGAIGAVIRVLISDDSIE